MLELYVQVQDVITKDRKYTRWQDLICVIQRMQH